MYELCQCNERKGHRSGAPEKDCHIVCIKRVNLCVFIIQIYSFETTFIVLLINTILTYQMFIMLPLRH